MFELAITINWAYFFAATLPSLIPFLGLFIAYLIVFWVIPWVFGYDEGKGFWCVLKFHGFILGIILIIWGIASYSDWSNKVLSDPKNTQLIVPER